MPSPYIRGKLPHYVTCDSAHRTCHVLFERTLQRLDRGMAKALGAFAA